MLLQIVRLEYIVVQQREKLPDTDYTALSALFSVGLFFQALGFLTSVYIAIMFLGCFVGGLKVYQLVSLKMTERREKEKWREREREIRDRERD